MPASRLERTLRWVATVAAGLWIATRLAAPLGPTGALAWPSAHPAGAFLFVDPFAPLVLLATLAWTRKPIAERYARACVLVLTLLCAYGYALLALGRYWGGHSMAWDLATFVQPMWRSAHGLPMTSTWLAGELPLWGDHGSFVFFLFAPLTRVGSDAASALLIAQALGVAACVPLAYAAARALQLPAAIALCCALMLACSRALASAASFDFHPEHLLPALLLAVLWAHATGRTRTAIACALTAALLKDMAALTIGGACMYLALRDKRPSAFVACCGAFFIAAIDIAVLPRLLGWPSYLATATARAPELGLALETTLLRGASFGALGWLHPIAWIAGGPWIAAAGWAQKLGVKGVDYQYAFLWVPVGLAGALYTLAYVQRRWPERLRALACGLATWTALVNAPLPLERALLRPRARAFEQLRGELGRAVPETASVGVDACVAPLLIDRLDLRGLCLLDDARYAATNEERWDLPAARALAVDRIVIDRTCGAHGACLAEQLKRARAAGFRRVPTSDTRFLVVAR